MGNYEQLKQAVADVIKTNGNQEITGQIMQNILLSIISIVGKEAMFAGIATPSTNPGTPEQNVFYIASEKGLYVNFNGFILNDEVLIFINKNGIWQKLESGIATKESVENKQDKLNFDNTPQEGSNNPVTSNGIRVALDEQKNEVDAAKDEALEAIKENEENAILNFNSQRVTPEMLSESTLQLIQSSGGGTITNFADDEDIESVDNGLGVNVLKLANREYDPINFIGKGYKIIRKNIVDGKNLLTQDMINDPDTIYDIRYNFDLNGATLNFPDNVELFFNGGSITNGDFNNIRISNLYLRPEWFGAKGNGIDDDTLAFETMLKINAYLFLLRPNATYIISKTIDIKNAPGRTIKCDGCQISNIKYIGDNGNLFDFTNGYSYFKMENVRLENSGNNEEAIGLNLEPKIQNAPVSSYNILNVKAIGFKAGIRITDTKGGGLIDSFGCSITRPNQVGVLLDKNSNGVYVSINEYITIKRCGIQSDYRASMGTSANIYPNTYGVHVKKGSHLLIEECDLDFMSAGIYLDDVDTDTTSGARSIKIKNNTIIGNNTGIKIDLRTKNINGVYVYNNNWENWNDNENNVWIEVNSENNKYVIGLIDKETIVQAFPGFPSTQMPNSMYRINNNKAYCYLGDVILYSSITFSNQYNLQNCKYIVKGNNNNRAELINPTYINNGADLKTLIKSGYYIGSNTKFTYINAPTDLSEERFVMLVCAYDDSLISQTITTQTGTIYNRMFIVDVYDWGWVEVSKDSAVQELKSKISPKKINGGNISEYKTIGNYYGNNIEGSPLDINENFTLSVYQNGTGCILQLFTSINNGMFYKVYYNATSGDTSGTQWKKINESNIFNKLYGTFSEKPLSQNIETGYSYFCTDKKTTEGGRNGIVIYYDGNENWVDALGRIVS